jgi:hypothetical protein
MMPRVQTSLILIAVAFCTDMAARPAVAQSDQAPPRRQIDDAQVRAAGIRKLDGRHITLYTDLPSSPAVDDLPTVFDLAFPQWCDYFGIDAREHADWKLNGFIINDKPRFRAIGLLPDDLPPFLHGFARGHEIWLYEQETDFYRRHLFLHEGTHAFMWTILGECGPSWYMEGIAELFGTHQWDGKQLTMRAFPAHKEDAPGWGRVKIVKDAVAAGRALSLSQVMSLSSEGYLKNEPYGWSWAVATFLNGHPAYRDRFGDVFKDVLRRDFNRRFADRFKTDWDELAEEWQLFIGGLEYGYDVGRMAIDFKPGRPLPSSGAKVTLATDRGWQSSEVRLEAGRKYRLRATGRYQVAKDSKPWMSEANGVSIRYYGGRPLGVLLAAVRPDKPETGAPSALLSPTVIGLGAELTPQQTGTLYLRVNDSPAELADNAGSLTAEITTE